MLRPGNLGFCIMNPQYVANSCLLARSFFKAFWLDLSSSFFRNLDNLRKIICFSVTTVTNQSTAPQLGLNYCHRPRRGNKSAIFLHSCCPPHFIFNLEVVYFFMIATSVCSQCQLSPPATLCSIIPVLTPKSP